MSFAAPETLLDYDIAIWNPANILEGFWADGQTLYEGLPALSEAKSFSLQRDAERRKKEFKTFLELGRTLVLFLPPPTSWFVDTGEKSYSGTGRNRSTTRMVRAMGLDEIFPFALKTT